MASTRIIKFIGGHEGKVLSWYLDPTHTPTIGYGFTWASKVFREWWTAKYGRKMRRGDTITETDALEVLKLMVEQEYAPPVDAKFAGRKVNVREGGYSTSFNAGPGSLKWKWADAIARGDITTGATLLRTTATTSKGQSLPGLVRRRGEEADLIQFNRWPAWLEAQASSPIPQTVTYLEDIKQAQQWLAFLGYYKGEIDGIAGGKTVLATKQFQHDHGTLRVDGIIGPATLAALKRSKDLVSKGGAVIATGSGGVAAGTVDGVTGASDQALPHTTGLEAPWLSDLLIWGGVAVIAIGIVWLAWRYRDEINAILRRL